MQVNIGGKIKELRKRDGRKQEELANALGVTAQAVSRWESNGCYPDMSLLPAIANYFHISIDALFGYDNDRDSRIKEYTEKYNRFFIQHDAGTTDLTAVISEIREILIEFPREPELLRLLAMALSMQGRKLPDRPNTYLEEAAEILEGLLGENDSVIFSLLDIYTTMGRYEKAVEKAESQPLLRFSKEVLLASLNDTRDEPFVGKTVQKYQGEAILSLLHELLFVITNAVGKNKKTYNSKEGLDILLSLRSLYEAIFCEGDFGKYHSDMCMLDLSATGIAARSNDYDLVTSCFDDAFRHYCEFKKTFIDEKNAADPDESFTSPLLEKTSVTPVPIVVLRPEYFKSITDMLPENIKKTITGNPSYKCIFAQN